MALPNFSSKKKTANQPTTAAVPENPVTKKGRDCCLAIFFLVLKWGGGGELKKTTLSTLYYKDACNLKRLLEYTSTFHLSLMYYKDACNLKGSLAKKFTHKATPRVKKIVAMGTDGTQMTLQLVLILF